MVTLVQDQVQSCKSNQIWKIYKWGAWQRSKEITLLENKHSFWENPFWGRERKIIILGRMTLDVKGEKVEAHSKDWEHASLIIF